MNLSRVDYNNKTITVNLDDEDNDRNFEMNKVDFTFLVDSAFVYPAYKSIKDKELKEIPQKCTFNYSCDSESCQFPIKEILQSVELKGLGISDTTYLVVKTINDNQKLFTARECGGYIFQANGRSNVLVRNQSVNDLNEETRFGFIDLTKTRRRLIHKLEVEALQKAETQKRIWENAIIGGATVGGGVAGGAFVFGILKAMNKIH